MVVRVLVKMMMMLIWWWWWWWYDSNNDEKDYGRDGDDDKDGNGDVMITMMKPIIYWTLAMFNVLYRQRIS